ncbi:unnamed protein product [Meganyctiphanes norvegica]|uniref:Uncharacterized protein n=1 Tax=Meganyctiphanes norvegica TaxID=48144 RepID=A0AAV2S2S6_MEGNR
MGNNDGLKQVFKNYLTLFFAIVSVFATVYDIYTDAKSTERICTSDCTCLWRNDSVDCDMNSNDTTGCVRGKYKWSRYTETCWPPDESVCSNALLPDSNMTGKEFCDDKYLKSPNSSHCSAEEWPPIDLRHPLWCSLSITTMAVSSIIGNAFLMYRLIFFYGIYCQILGFTRLAATSQSTMKYAVTAVIIMLSCSQLLSLTWLLLLVYSAYLQLKGIGGQDQLEFTTVTFKTIFTLLEDIPHLFLQTIFITRALMGLEEGIDVFSPTAIAGIVLTCTNGAWNSSFAIKSKPKRIAAAIFTSITFYSRVAVLTYTTGIYALYFIVPGLMLYELTRCKSRTEGTLLSDIFATEGEELTINHNPHSQGEFHGSGTVFMMQDFNTRDLESDGVINEDDHSQEDFSNNEINIRHRLLDYVWRCIDGLLFDGLSLRGLLVSSVYLFFVFRFYEDGFDVSNKYFTYMCLASMILNILFILGKFIWQMLKNNI